MAKYNKETIGKRIKKVRQELGYSMEKFGEIVDSVSKGTVSHWENGTNLPNEYRMEKIAKLVGKDIEWLKYGTMDEYILEKLYLFEDYLKDPAFYDQLVTKLKKNKVKVGDFDNLIKIVATVRPELKDKNITKATIENEEKTKDEIYSYEIVNNKHFIDVYVPMLDGLFAQESKIENDLNRYNDQILMRTLDMLDRMNPQTKEKMNEVMKIISWIATNNIFRLEIQEISQRAVYGGFTYGSYEKQKDRNLKEIKKDLKQLTGKVSDLLNEICMENYNEFQKKEYKSLFR
ncbi:XRE family transcriptional regulator [Sporolactobacillus shoreae]|uniref:XRE family transcriptional regulator n=1 Tax=Sporolactobacillus shoreae TaxID=1465501 RepID=A0A4Z0GIA2_9BACL|nr:helix-turn-helix transcriptional regulator [Sporolactobacillus shoreae]TGA95899.1 XRE family transcriptional regulator [Sporolactobacillus shoreae]